MAAPPHSPSQRLTAALLAVLLLATAISLADANFHVMNVHTSSGGQALYLVPSNNYKCGGIQKKAIANTQYPDCSAGYLHIPDGQCGYSGVTIKPSCSGNYFGKLYGDSGNSIGDCYWNDAGSTYSFQCGSSFVYDRLVCYSSMCGS